MTINLRFSPRIFRQTLRHSHWSQRGGSVRALGLLTVMLLTACASATSPTVLPVEPNATFVPTATQPPAATQVVDTATETPGEIPVAAATSRGPDLEATDPTTVSLASGEIQFVEFFRFT